LTSDRIPRIIITEINDALLPARQPGLGRLVNGDGGTATKISNIRRRHPLPVQRGVTPLVLAGRGG
jgi:hypothetical protein